MRIHLRLALIPTLVLLGAIPRADSLEPPATPDARWGSRGHEMAARAAMSVLPPDLPDFFRAAEDQIVYLDPEPDRWRVGSRQEMSGAWAPDHYVNFENVPSAALEAESRYAYVAALLEAGIRRPDREAGFLPFTIVELYERLVTEWELWRREPDPDRRSWIEDRIVNDAGILGHFVTDGSQPHHTTIHYDGWAEGVPGPAGYTREPGFHARFETIFVDAYVEPSDVAARVEEPGSVAGAARPAVMEYLRETHALVDELYRLDRDVGFDPDAPPRPETTRFTAERLAAGATMLALLWRSAWVESAGR